MSRYLLLFDLLAGGGLFAAVWLFLRPEGVGVKLRAGRIRAAATASVMRWFYGDPDTPGGQEKRRVWALKLKYSGLRELHVRLASLALAVIFFSMYLDFSLSVPAALAYGLIGSQLPYILVESLAAARESMAVTQTASFISAFTDGLEMKMTVNDALSNAGKTVSGPPVGGDIRETLHQIKMGGYEKESLRALGERLGNRHLVNFGDVVGQVKRSGADDPTPFRLLEWVTQEEEKLQSEFVGEVMVAVIFLGIMAVMNLLALPVLKYAFHQTWVQIISIKWLLFCLPIGALALLWGIRSYATRRVAI
ncbi:MAG: hypothetical protein M0Z41_05215 [Peptococcaceae bacterium]|jgi:hypothetical protein|nr:hypothetical protein [Peptococcaceae bacterium]